MPTLVQVECLGIEKKKQPVYRLSLQWSDGRVFEVEKSHSAFVELRTVLKKNYYCDQRDVQIPEVPAVKKFEIGTAAKKDEKRKKSVEEFCLQLARLPDVVGKVNPVREFFVAYDDSGLYKLATGFEDEGAYSNAELMEHETKEAAKKGKPCQEKSNGIKAKDKKKPKEKGQERSDGKQVQEKVNKPPQKSETPADLSTLYAEVSKPKPLNYIDVDISDTGKDERSILAIPPIETLYAEIGPTSPERPKTNAPSVPPPKGGGVKNQTQNVHKYSPVEPTRKADPVPPPLSTQQLNSKQSRPPAREVPFPKKEHTEDEEGEEGNGSGQNSEQNRLTYQYQNFPVTSLNFNEKKLYVVTESFVPNTAFSQYLAVENGDIVEVQAISGDKYFCTLHATHLRQMEGWLPRNILQPCNSGNPDVPLVPITPIPPKPSTFITSSHGSEGHSEPQKSSTLSEIKVIAIADYKSEDDSVLSFEKGLLAELISGEDPDWWCIRIGFVNGWVPANCWQLVQETRESLSSSSQMKIADAAYFVGSLSRCACEDLLMKFGLHLDFVVRESSNLVGQFALSVRHFDHIHHFPIVLTEDNKYYIGKHRFKTVDNVISYYQRNDLFVDDDGSAVRLGNPFVPPSEGNHSTEVDV